MIESLCSYDGPDGSWSCRLIVARSYRGAKWNLKRDRFMFRWWFFNRILHPMTIIMEMFDYGVILQPWLSRVFDSGKQRRKREITPIHLCNLFKHQSQKQNTGQVPSICFRFNLFINLRCLMSFSSSIRWTTTTTRSAVESSHCMRAGVSTNGRRFYSGVPTCLCPTVIVSMSILWIVRWPFQRPARTSRVLCRDGVIIVWRWLLSCSWHLLMRNS